MKHQILNPDRKQRHEIPPWTQKDDAIAEVLLRTFPKLKEVGSRDYLRAARWARVIHLYFRVGSTIGYVAKEMGVTYNTIKCILKHIRRVSNGRSADGQRKLGERLVGRPRNS